MLAFANFDFPYWDGWLVEIYNDTTQLIKCDLFCRYQLFFSSTEEWAKGWQANSWWLPGPTIRVVFSTPLSNTSIYPWKQSYVAFTAVPGLSLPFLTWTYCFIVGLEPEEIVNINLPEGDALLLSASNWPLGTTLQFINLKNISKLDIGYIQMAHTTAFEKYFRADFVAYDDSLAPQSKFLYNLFATDFLLQFGIRFPEPKCWQSENGDAYCRGEYITKYSAC